MKYLKIKNECQSKIWLLYWCDYFGNLAGANNNASAVQANQTHVVYFRETK